MNIIKQQPTEQETTVALQTANPGDVFRFAFLSFTAALKEDAFYMIIRAPEKKVFIWSIYKTALF